MNINNDTNISSMVSQSLSRLNLNTLNRSYKSSEKKENDAKIDNSELLKEEDTLNSSNSVISKNNIDVEEIQKYASQLGEKLSIEDINYGLKYGRSVIANYSA